MHQLLLFALPCKVVLNPAEKFSVSSLPECMSVCRSMWKQVGVWVISLKSLSRKHMHTSKPKRKLQSTGRTSYWMTSSICRDQHFQKRRQFCRLGTRDLQTQRSWHLLAIARLFHHLTSTIWTAGMVAGLEMTAGNAVPAWTLEVKPTFAIGLWLFFFNPNQFSSFQSLWLFHFTNYILAGYTIKILKWVYILQNCPLISFQVDSTPFCSSPSECSNDKSLWRILGTCSTWSNPYWFVLLVSNRYDQQVDDNPSNRFNYGGTGGSWCAPYKTWARIYSYDITFNLTEGEAALVLGGEVALWSEQADETVLDSRLWPRAAAAAESLWSGNKGANGVDRASEALTRLNDWRYRLVARGIRAEPLQPLWCVLHPGGCNINS